MVEDAGRVILHHLGARELDRVRDGWLRGVLVLAALAVLPSAPWLTPLGLWWAWRWQSRLDLEALVPWLFVGLTWWLLRAIPPVGWLGVRWALVGLGLAESVRLMLSPRAIEEGPRRRRLGSLGSPMGSALLLALVAPLAPPWLWPVLLTGWWLTGSWLALGAMLAAGCVLYPPALLIVAPGSVAALVVAATGRGRNALDRWTPRGANLDGVRGRWLVLRLVAQEARWQGAGPRTMLWAMARWAARRGQPLLDAMCCEPAHLVYEYGLAGGLAIVLFVVQVGRHLELGDPWSAAWVAGVVLSLGHFPLRIAPLGVMFLAISSKVVGG